MAQWALSPPRHGRYRGGPDKRARQIRGSYSRVVGDAEGAIDYVVWERIACVQLIACAAYTRHFDELHQKREASHGALPFSLTLLIIRVLLLYSCGSSLRYVYNHPETPLKHA